MRSFNGIAAALAAVTVLFAAGVAAQEFPDEVYLPTAPESEASNVLPWKPAPPQWAEMLSFYVDNDIFPGVSVLYKSPNWGVRFVSAGQPIVGKDKFKFKPSTQFRIGSCSKATVSIVMLQMDYEHKLNLSDPITMHLPPEITDKIPHAESITIRSCLDMTSGLRSYTDIVLLGDPQPDTALNHYQPTDILNMAMDYDSPEFLPDTTEDGEHFNYNYTNTGYLICGLIAERIDGKPLHELLRDRVFDKIGMSDTFLAQDYRITRRMAHGYTAFYETGAWQDGTIYDQSVPWAAGAVISTPFDLLHFYQTIFESEHLLKDLSRRKFLRMNYAEEHKGYGKAILEEIVPAGSTIGHGGTVLGYLTLMLHSPDENFYYISYINTWDNKYCRVEVCNRILHLALGSPEMPSPADGVDAPLKNGGVTLSWYPGNLSGEEYHVYVGTNEQAVVNATLDSHSGVSLERASELSLVKRGLKPGTRYYWRVDTHHKKSEREIQYEQEDIETLIGNFNTYAYRDVDDYDTIPGPTWSFTAK